jgi:lysozyme
MLTRRQLMIATPAAVAAGAGLYAQQSAAWLKGIDVSRWQETISWNAVKNSGVVFAFCKATEGTSYVDPYFTTNWPAIKSVGIIRGAYHFARPATDPQRQADHFLRTVRPIKGDLKLVLDLEDAGGKTKNQVWAWTQAFVNRIKVKTGQAPIIYTGYYFWQDSVGNPTNNLGCPLWLPNYGSSPANLIPVAWTKWTFWQYTDTGTVPGVAGNCDRNYFNGNLAALKALTY